MHQLRQFLAFIYADYQDGFHFTADYLPLVFDEPIEDVRKRKPGIVEDFVKGWSLEVCQRIQKEVREDFKEWVEKAQQGTEIRLGKVELFFSMVDRPGVGKVFTIRRQPELGPAKEDPAAQLLKRALFHLVELKENALRICEECERYFIQSDRRPARFCSQRCRVAAAQRRLREKELARRKGKKRR